MVSNIWTITYPIEGFIIGVSLSSIIYILMIIIIYIKTNIISNDDDELLIDSDQRAEQVQKVFLSRNQFDSFF